MPRLSHKQEVLTFTVLTLTREIPLPGKRHLALGAGIATQSWISALALIVYLRCSIHRDAARSNELACATESFESTLVPSVFIPRLTAANCQRVSRAFSFASTEKNHEWQPPSASYFFSWSCF